MFGSARPRGGKAQRGVSGRPAVGTPQVDGSAVGGVAAGRGGAGVAAGMAGCGVALRDGIVDGPQVKQSMIEAVLMPLAFWMMAGAAAADILT